MRNLVVRGIVLQMVCLGVFAAERLTLVPKWERFERVFQSTRTYANPVQDLSLKVVFTSPSGESRTIDGFWDGGKTWKVRFKPNEVGRWIYTSVCSDPANRGLDNQSGTFTCTAPSGKNRFSRHGPVRVAPGGTYLMHEDGAPFFWMGDTAWNGALLSSPAQWRDYLEVRSSQGFNVVQWVTTQWRAAPRGNRLNQPACTGERVIQINPHFFQELDPKVDALNQSGFLNAPVLLWAHPGHDVPKNSPGFALPEDQAIVLARYMLARWGANDVAWILAGDGDYRGKNAAKWIRVGRALFAQGKNASVLLHPGGMHWVLPEFQAERWLDVLGYQSGHGDDDAAVRWIVFGPPATDWKKEPRRPFINLEPPYEYHIAYQSGRRISPEQVRRAVYWSLLVAPTAGVTYGGHGVWGWDDGTKPPTDHPYTGTPLPLKNALVMPGAEQMAFVSAFFNSIQFWRLRPAPDLLVRQPGGETPRKFIAVSQTDDRAQTVAYIPEAMPVILRLSGLPRNHRAAWFNPRNGRRTEARSKVAGEEIIFEPTEAGDWLLLIERP